jgi:hypothetical protein
VVANGPPSLPAQRSRTALTAGQQHPQQQLNKTSSFSISHLAKKKSTAPLGVTT